MRRPRTDRARNVVLALLLAAVPLLATASPAGAGTPVHVDWKIESGSFTTHWDSGEIALPVTGSPECAPPPDATTPSITVTMDPTVHTAHIAGASSYVHFDTVDVTIGGTPHRMVVSGDTTTTSGSYNPGTNAFTQDVDLRFAVQDCAGSTTQCTFDVEGTIHGTDYTGGTAPVVGDTVTLAGASAPITVALGCDESIRSAVLGSTVGILFHLEAVDEQPPPPVHAKWEVDSGVFTTHWDSQQYELPPSGTTICVPPGASTPSLTLTMDPTHHTSHIAGAASYVGFYPFDMNYAGTNYQLGIAGSTGTRTGAYDPLTGTFAQNVGFTFTIRNCAGTTTLCTFSGTGVLSGYHDGHTTPAVGDAMTVQGSLGPLTTQIGCNVAFRPSILGSTVSVLLHMGVTQVT